MIWKNTIISHSLKWAGYSNQILNLLFSIGRLHYLDRSASFPFLWIRHQNIKSMVNFIASSCNEASFFISYNNSGCTSIGIMIKSSINVQFQHTSQRSTPLRHFFLVLRLPCLLVISSDSIYGHCWFHCRLHNFIDHKESILRFAAN